MTATAPVRDSLLARRGVLTALLVATILVGAAVRYVGVLWGLPMQLHADEWVVVEYAIDLASRNSFEPAFFARPDHLEIQLSYLAYQVWAHVFHGTSPEALFATTQAPFYAISRTITATFGTAMIPLAYLIGRTLNRPIGLLMAVGVALFPPFIEHSRFATPDIPLTFTVMLVMLGCVLYLEKPGWWPLLLATAGVALGITVKYPAALGTLAIAAVVIIVAIRDRHPLQILSRGAAAAGLVVGITFALSPVLFTNASEVIHQLTAQNSEGHLGASGLGWGGNLQYYAIQMLTSGGLLLVLFAVAGGVWAVATRRWAAVPLALGIVYWIALSRLSLHWDRWGLPMYLTVVLFAAIGVYAAVVWARGLTRLQRPARWTVGILAGISGVTLLLGAVAQAAFTLVPDTRQVAAEELPEWGATPENTVYDGYTPFLPDGPATIASELEVVDGRLVPREEGADVDFILTSSLMSGRYLRDPTREESAVYVVLRDDETPIARWIPVGGPPAGAFELPRIVSTLGYLGALAGGGMSGPRLALYEFPG